MFAQRLFNAYSTCLRDQRIFNACLTFVQRLFGVSPQGHVLLERFIKFFQGLYYILEILELP